MLRFYFKSGKYIYFEVNSMDNVTFFFFENPEYIHFKMNIFVLNIKRVGFVIL